MKQFLILIGVALSGLATFAQTSSADSAAIVQMQKDVRYLAADRMEGREAGTRGEQMAAQFIANRMEAIGLKPNGGRNNYYQEFPFTSAPRAKRAELTIDGISKNWGREFYPVNGSGSGEASAALVFVGYGIQAPELGHDDYAKKKLNGKIAVLELGDPEGGHPHSKYLRFHDLATKVGVAEEHGAVAVLVLNSDQQLDDPSPNLNKHSSAASIPVVLVKGTLADLKLEKKSKAGLKVQIVQEEKNAINVIGYLNNAAQNTVVVGAHFDHLGMGDEGSLHRGEPAIHNGADDNASGVAAMLQIAEDLSRSNLKNNNYMFIAFSGEEKGLLGSNYFMKHPMGEPDGFNYMMNMDMVGRLDSTEKTLGVNAVGTSPAWSVLDSISVGGMKIKTTESGVGPSDHTSFYLKDIPVLHFFSGTHADYHKPSDDEHLINYEGMLYIVRYMEEIIQRLDDQGKIEFTKTKDQDNESAPRFTVTLGVVPDYLFDGEGMRIDGVSDDRPAHKAGLKAGDVVIKLGDHEVKDMMSYMKALSLFKKGDASTVEVLRDKEIIKTDIQF